MPAPHTEQDYATVGQDRGIEWIGPVLPPNARTTTKWRCPKGHTFDATYNKIQQGRDCTTCGKKRRADHSRFGEEHYQRAGIGRNFKWIGKVVPANARTPTPWECEECGHKWEASLSNIGHRTRPTGCRKCSGKAPLTEQDYIDLAAKRGIVWIGSDLPKYNDTETEWRCGQGHEFEASHASLQRDSGSSGCPFCAGKRVSKTNSLASRHPEIAAEWHPTKNGNLTPADVTAGSNRKVWWRCPKGPDHEWPASIAKRTGSGRGCPFCAGKRLSITNSLARLYPEIASQWHPTNNGNLTPDKVVAGIPKKAWWKCPEGPDHEWPATLANRTKGDTGCPCCAGRQVSITNSLASRHPEIAAEWHPTKNGNLTPSDVTASSNKKAWWKCPEGPDHEWPTTINNRTGLKHGCPVCAQTGFDPSIPAIAYYIRIETGGEPLYKIGVTNRTVAERFHRDTDRVKIKVIKEWEFNSGAEALEFETNILTCFRDQRYDGPQVLIQRGNTEIFEVDVLDLDK